MKTCTQKIPLDFTLYLITDRKLFADEDIFFAGIEEAFRGGVRAVQLREKDLTIRELLAMAYRLKELTVRYGAKLFINDRVDVALAVDADGVHLGGAGIPASAARMVAGKEMRIGVSAHHVGEAKKAEQEGADFVTFGPVFETPSKLKYGRPLGPELLSEACRALSIPVFGIGGIKPAGVERVIKAGASGVAVISAILDSADIQSTTEEFMRLLK